MWNHSLFRIAWLAGLHRIDAMFLEPFVHVETEVLLAPQHPGQRLPHDAGLIFADPSGVMASIEFIRVGSAGLQDFSKLLPERIACFGRAPDR